MKKVYLLLLLILSSLTVVGQDKFYVYQKDGDVRAFFCNEIDSITYSRLDTNKVMQPDFVTQLISLQDTTYQIPLNNIDSVSFIDPPIIYADNVVFATNNILQNLETIQDSVLIINESIPYFELPKEGQIWISTEQADFVGKVQSVEKKNNKWHITLTEPALTDIYEQLIIVEKIPASELFAVDEASLRAGNNNFEFGNDNNYGFSGSVVLHELQADFVRIETNINNKVLKGMSLSFVIYPSLNFGIKADWERNISFPLVKQTVRIAQSMGVLAFKFDLNVFARIKGSIDFSVNFTRRFVLGAELKDGIWRSGLRAANTFDHYLKYKFVGSAAVGLNFNLGIGTSFWVDTFGIATEAAFQIEGDISAVADANLNPDIFYNENKDSQLKIYYPWSIGALVPEKLKQSFKDNLIYVDFTFFSGRFGTAFERYLFPQFDLKASVPKESPTKAILELNVARKLLFPLSVGTAVWNENGDPIFSEYAKTLYNNSGFTNPFKTTFNHVEEGKTYRARPIINFMNKTIVCSPEVTFLNKKEEENDFPEELLGQWEFRDPEAEYWCNLFLYANGTFFWEDNGATEDGGYASGSGEFAYDADTKQIIFLGGPLNKGKLEGNTLTVIVLSGSGAGDVWDFHKRQK